MGGAEARPQWHNSSSLDRRLSYEWGYLYDPTHPVPAGPRLTGCRDIEPSPWVDEAGRVFYFCGDDGGIGPCHSTAWIYGGALIDKEGRP